jgi:hypothetical protein
MVRRDNGRRLERLEKLYEASTDERYSPIDPDLAAVLDEYGCMKADMSEKRYRGGIQIEPVNAAAEVFGPAYTQQQFRSLTISRVLEKRGRSAAEIAERMDEYLALFEEGDRDEHIGAID